MEDIEDMKTDELQAELDSIYAEVENSGYMEAISRIVSLEIELEKRSNI